MSSWEDLSTDLEWVAGKGKPTTESTLDEFTAYIELEAAQGKQSILVEFSAHLAREAAREAAQRKRKKALDAALDAARKAAREAAREATPEAAAEAAVQAALDAALDATLDEAREAAREAAPEAALKAAHEIALEVAREAALDAALEVARRKQRKADKLRSQSSRTQPHSAVDVENPKKSVDLPVGDTATGYPAKDTSVETAGSTETQTEETGGGEQRPRFSDMEDYGNPESPNENVSEDNDDVDMHCPYCSVTSPSTSSLSSSDGEGGEHTELPGLENQDRQHPQDPPPPIFSHCWQIKTQFDHKGGRFQKDGSDVILSVPPDAVMQGSSVEIHCAVSVDVGYIRHLLDLPDEEQVVSPLAEFWAGQDFRFQTPVCITLPHYLPKNFDSDLMNVYNVMRGSSNKLAVSRIDQIPPESNAAAEETRGLKDPDQAQLKDHCFQLAERHIAVFTEHFCGYVCTYCEKKYKKGLRYKPQLYLMASGSIWYPPVPKACPWVDVRAYVWDRRICVADNRTKHGITKGPWEYIELKEDWRESSKLLVSKRNDDYLTCRKFSDGTPIHSGEVMTIDVPSCFGCQKCAFGDNQVPRSHKWLMESQKRPLPFVEVSVNVTYETAANSVTTALPLKLPMTERMSATTQTAHNGVQSENTEMKNLPSAVTSCINNSVKRGASGEGSHLASTRAADNGSTSPFLSNPPHPQEASVEQQMPGMRLEDPDPASNSLTGESSGNTRGTVNPGSGQIQLNINYSVYNDTHIKGEVNLGNTYTHQTQMREAANHTIPAPPQPQPQLQPQPSPGVPSVPIVEPPEEETGDSVEQGGE